MTLRRALPALAVLALVPVLAACGNKEKVVTFADTEGVYVDVGELKYQVQISAQLNPSIPEDRTFLSGLAPADRSIAADEAWFAVFVRLQNDTDKAHAAATSYAITDTEGGRYTPLRIGASNPFHYVGGRVPAGEIVPGPNSIASQTSIGGVELLFKLKRTSLDNRPLILHIHSPERSGATARISLDV